jgi:hypothetical protein
MTRLSARTPFGHRVLRVARLEEPKRRLASSSGIVIQGARRRRLRDEIV